MAQTSGDSAVATAAERAASGASRLLRAWRTLPSERRMAAYSSAGLFFALFLPWYQETVIVSGKATTLQSASVSITGWGAFSFVEAALLLIAAGVLVVLFRRAEARPLHLPGGDGGAVTSAGLLACLLIVWAIFEKQGTSVRGPGATTSGIEWGIIVALAIAATLTYAGSRIRTAPPTRAASTRAKPAGATSPGATDATAPLSPSRSRSAPPDQRRSAPRPVSAQPAPTTPAAAARAARDEQLTIPFERGTQES